MQHKFADLGDASLYYVIAGKGSANAAGRERQRSGPGIGQAANADLDLRRSKGPWSAGAGVLAARRLERAGRRGRRRRTLDSGREAGVGDRGDSQVLR